MDKYQMQRRFFTSGFILTCISIKGSALQRLSTAVVIRNTITDYIQHTADIVAHTLSHTRRASVIILAEIPISVGSEKG